MDILAIEQRGLRVKQYSFSSVETGILPGE